jgi:hypothetical protein
MNDNKFQREVLDRLMRLETKIDLQDYKGISEKVDIALNKANNNEERINKLEDSNKWIARLVIGAIIGGILAFVFKI